MLFDLNTFFFLDLILGIKHRKLIFSGAEELILAPVIEEAEGVEPLLNAEGGEEAGEVAATEVAVAVERSPKSLEKQLPEKKLKWKIADQVS